MLIEVFPVRDATVHRLGTALTETDLAAATAAGRMMSLDEVIAEALAVDPTAWASDRQPTTVPDGYP